MNLKEPLNIDALLGKAKNLITLVGVELEGGWITVPNGTQVIRDGSVRGLRAPGGAAIVEVGAAPPVTPAQVERHASRTRHPGESLRDSLIRAGQELGVSIQGAPAGRQMQVGEIPSPVMPPSEVPIWMRRYYPQSVNETCGLHVHMSFENSLLYQRLMVPSYQATILHYVTLWAKDEAIPKDHPLWPRLNGSSVYCQHQFWPDRQVATRGKDHDQRREGHRYTVINFCYSTTGTVECRLLPMMETPDQGIRAVQRILDITNAFLMSGKYKEPRFSASTVAQEDAFGHTKRVTLSETRRSGELR